MHSTPTQHGAALVTPGGLVDADTAVAPDIAIWHDATALRSPLESRDTSIPSPRQRDTAA